MRLANIVTAISDVLAGIAIAGSLISIVFGTQEHQPLGNLIVQQRSSDTLIVILLLCLSTVGLYGGGVVLNDVFDATLDKRERPERPIPSGLISKRSAAVFGILLLLGGIMAAALSNNSNLFSQSTVIAAAIALLAVIYDKWSKHNSFFGPLNMGLCRGLNLLLGMSILDYAIQFYWWLAIFPVIYIAAVTMVSRGEVHGGKKNTLYFAAALFAVVIGAILIISYQSNTLTKSLPMVAMFALIVFPALQKAIASPVGPNIGKAVKTSILALIAINGAWAAAFGDMIVAGTIFLLLPLSYLLARMFAVT